MKKIIALTLALLMSFSCFSIISFAEETQKTTEHLTQLFYEKVKSKKIINSVMAFNGHNV